MPDPLLDALERTVRNAAQAIVDSFDRELIPPRTALAIAGAVAARLLDRVPHDDRTRFVEAIQAAADA